MKRLSLAITLLTVMLFTGCGSSQPSLPKVETTEKFNLERISLVLKEKVTAEIKYHTQDELNQLLNDEVMKELNERNLLSTDKMMNVLNIDVVYKRRFVGDETPLPSDSLAYPFIDYKIDVMDGTKRLTEINQKDMTYKGGFTMNMQVIAGTLRDKKYEIEFIQAVANKIVDDIVELQEN